jgi:hypothetical protein
VFRAAVPVWGKLTYGRELLFGPYAASIIPPCNASGSGPSNTSANRAPRLANGGSGHADATNESPKRAAAVSHLRDQTVRLRIGAGVIACADVATAKAKPATAINLIILPSVTCRRQRRTEGGNIHNAGRHSKSEPTCYGSPCPTALPHFTCIREHRCPRATALSFRFHVFGRVAPTRRRPLLVPVRVRSSSCRICLE